MITRLPAILAVPVVLALDMLTKRSVEHWLTPGVPVPILDTVMRWRLGYNPGIAFGLFATGERLWLVLTAFGVIGLSVWFGLRLSSSSPSAAALPLGLMLGGALANFLDRWADGQVTDFIDLGIGDARWPVFNLADAAITLGVAVLLIEALRGVQPVPRIQE